MYNAEGSTIEELAERVNELQGVEGREEELHYLLGYMDGIHERELRKTNRNYTRKVRVFMKDKRRKALEYNGDATEDELGDDYEYERGYASVNVRLVNKHIKKIL